MVSLEEIIKECKQYNKFAQKILYERYAPIMNGICFRYVNNIEITKDIVQEGFIKVFTNIRKYKGTGSFEGWMKRIFINLSISYLRKSKHEHFLNIDDIEENTLIEEDIDKLVEIPETQSENGIGKTDFQIVSLADFSESELLKVLENLPDKYRIVFNLHCIEKFKHEEIAEMLGMDVASSRTRLMRARQMIKKELYAMSVIKLNKVNEQQKR